MTVNRERKMVAREQTYVSFEYDTLETVLKQVKQLIKDYGPNAKIISRCEPYSDSDKENMYVYVDKPETDKEMAERIAQEEKWEKDCQERDKANYERLQKIYGEKK